MRLNPPFDDLIPKLTAVYRLKVSWCQKLIDNGNATISKVRAGPKPGC